MFDITSSKLLLLGIVALIVIGPKDLPVLLRTLGKYVGIIRRQAAEFRAQFEEAVRESELDQLKKDVESMGAEAEASMRDAERTVTTELDAAKTEVESATDVALLEKPQDVQPYDVEAELRSDADGVPIVSGATKSLSDHSSTEGSERNSAATSEQVSSSSLNGATEQQAAEAHAESEPKSDPAAGETRVEQKAGA